MNKRRRLRKPVKRALTLIAMAILLAITIPMAVKIFSNPSRHHPGTIRVDNFEDHNKTHLRFAKKHGISPLKSGKEFQEKKDELVKKGKLVRIGDTKYYVINNLTHSHPYLVPEAAELLVLIGKRFHQKLENKELDGYQFKVTSLLRTGESQKRLSRTNGNASSNSAHLYGTTFDITYKNLIRRSVFGKERAVPDAQALRLLSETIGELQREKKLVVVTEYREACFHITIR